MNTTVINKEERLINSLNSKLSSITDNAFFFVKMSVAISAIVMFTTSAWI